MSVKRSSRKAINDSNRKYIELTSQERLFYFSDCVPIITLTWFYGDHIRAKESLEERLKVIVKENPWIQGRFKLKFGKNMPLYLSYSLDEYSVDDILTSVGADISPISRNTPFGKLDSCLKKYVIRNGKSHPIFNVTIIPCNENPHDRFAVMVQMSHAVGDGATYYKLLEMIFSVDEKTILKLNEVRINDSLKQQQAILGKKEEKLLRSLGFQLKVLWGFLLRILFRKSLIPKYGIVDLDKIEIAKQEAKKEGLTSFVSTNDIITSWYLQESRGKLGFMAVNWRDRLDGHSNIHAGNYENIIYYGKEDSATPSLIRQSLKTFRRVVTNDKKLPGFLACFRSPSIALVTNWSSFAKHNEIKGCEEDCHLPILWAHYIPTTMDILVIYRAGVGQLGLYTIQSGDVNYLDNAPFLQ